MGEPAGQRHRPIRARSTIQASRRGGRTKRSGSKPIAQTGLPACVLPTEAPVPDYPTLGPDPDRAFTEHFHPASTGGLVAAGGIAPARDEASRIGAGPVERD